MADSYKVFDKSPIIDDTVSIHGISVRKREIALGAVALVALVVCIVLAGVLAAVKSQGGTVGDGGLGSEMSTSRQTGIQGRCPACNLNAENMCLDPMCMKNAANVIESMNASIDPCTNFHQFACGTWAQRYPLKPDVTQLTPASNIYYENQVKLRQLMETPTIRNTLWSTERKLKDYFASCTDHFGGQILQGRPFLNKVVKESGGWSVLGSLNQQTYSFQQALKKTHVDFWTDAFFTFSLRTDWMDWQKIAIQIDLSGTGISWIYYVRPDAASFIADYKKFIKKIGTYLLRDSGVQLNKTEADRRIQQFVDDAYQVEYGLANITQHSDPTEDPHSHENRLSLEDLNTLTENAIDWVGFFSYMFESDLVNAKTKVVVLEVDYVKKMGQFINNLGPDKNRILNNYMTWRLAHKYVQDLSWDYIHANREFYVDMTGETEFLGTWRYCMGLVDRDMGEAVSSLFVRNHFSDANRDKSRQIVGELMTALVDSITNNKWMDDATRSLAEQKIKKSLYKMGYPDFMMKDDKLDTMYRTLDIDKHDYFGNRLNMNKFYKSDWNRRLRKGTDVEEWTYNTYAVIAEYYNPWRELIVPAGLLQWPLYDHKLPHFMNFGALGSILGHNLIHAIDQIGAQYRLDGSHFGRWWTNHTVKEYEKVKDCIVKAYANKTMGPFKLSLGSSEPISIPVDAQGYAPEALAETSGVRLAFKAFKRWESKNKVERSAPGLSYSNDQMFFIAYAQSNCFNRNGNEAFSQAARGVVQENLKVNMALSQVKEFQDAFKCSATSKMVAPKRCNMY